MRVINFQTEPPGRSALATFDVDLGPDVTLRRLVIRRNSRGVVGCYPGALRGGSGRSANLSPALAREILSLAVASLDETKAKACADDRSTRTQ